MWYVLWTPEGTEEKTRKLVDKNVDHSLFSNCIVPYKKKIKRHNGEYLYTTRVIFPSYEFIETNHIDDFANQLRGRLGKSALISSDGAYSPVKQEDFSFLMNLMDKNGVIEISNGYKDGDHVKVVSESLMGHEDRICKVIWRQHIAILDFMINERKLQTSVGFEQVENPVAAKSAGNQQAGFAFAA